MNFPLPGSSPLFSTAGISIRVGKGDLPDPGRHTRSFSPTGL